MILCVFFFFNDTATTEIYTLSLHDALPIYYFLYNKIEEAAGDGRPLDEERVVERLSQDDVVTALADVPHDFRDVRSEEHTSELQSRQYLVCRLLLEKKKK